MGYCFIWALCDFWMDTHHHNLELASESYNTMSPLSYKSVRGDYSVSQHSYSSFSVVHDLLSEWQAFFVDPVLPWWKISKGAALRTAVWMGGPHGSPSRPVPALNTFKFAVHLTWNLFSALEYSVITNARQWLSFWEELLFDLDIIKLLQASTFNKWLPRA